MENEIPKFQLAHWSAVDYHDKRGRVLQNVAVLAGGEEPGSFKLHRLPAYQSLSRSQALSLERELRRVLATLTRAPNPLRALAAHAARRQPTSPVRLTAPQAVRQLDMSRAAEDLLAAVNARA